MTCYCRPDHAAIRRRFRSGTSTDVGDWWATLGTLALIIWTVFYMSLLTASVNIDNRLMWQCAWLWRLDIWRCAVCHIESLLIFTRYSTNIWNEMWWAVYVCFKFPGYVSDNNWQTRTTSDKDITKNKGWRFFLRHSVHTTVSSCDEFSRRLNYYSGTKILLVIEIRSSFFSDVLHTCTQTHRQTAMKT